MRMMMTILVPAGLLAACGGTAEQAKPAEERAASLQPGEYEISFKVDAIRSTDNSTPATKSKVGDPPVTTRTCVPADGAIDPSAFAEAGEKCTVSDPYMRGGRMSLQLKCLRGNKQLGQLVDGQFTADSFSGTARTSTFFSGPGDYELTRTLTGKRIGECPAAAETAEKAPS